jgi:hypothetical protein
VFSCKSLSFPRMIIRFIPQDGVIQGHQLISAYAPNMHQQAKVSLGSLEIQVDDCEILMEAKGGWVILRVQICTLSQTC